MGKIVSHGIQLPTFPLLFLCDFFHICPEHSFWSTDVNVYKYILFCGVLGYDGSSCWHVYVRCVCVCDSHLVNMIYQTAQFKSMSCLVGRCPMMCRIVCASHVLHIHEWAGQVRKSCKHDNFDQCQLFLAGKITN